MQVNELFRQSNTILLDGGMGTMLQAAGMKAGALPELLNFEEPQVITDIQRQYVEAGCDVLVSGSYVFRASNPCDVIRQMKEL